MIFAMRYGGSDPLNYFVLLVLTLLAVCIALVLHEVAHGLVAKWNGDFTAKYAGRLTLNPLKHFDLIGFIMMMLIGFGYAKPVPVNPYNFKHRTRGMITVAIAGVVTNLIIAFIGSLCFCLMQWAWSYAMVYSTAGVARLCWYIMMFFSILTTINLSLVFFNILPIFPLDGFRVVEAFTHQGNKFCAFMRTNGQYILWGLVGLSFIVSSAQNYVNLPSWFGYIDILGTYLNFFVGNVSWLFTQLWWLMIP
ncbi:MAG: site-2 protease family protein [Clostridiales bacterium]|nr:site-2 protease family protein [Clostridiales bacterium]